MKHDEEVEALKLNFNALAWRHASAKLEEIGQEFHLKRARKRPGRPVLNYWMAPAVRSRRLTSRLTAATMRCLVTYTLARLTPRDRATSAAGHSFWTSRSKI